MMKRWLLIICLCILAPLPASAQDTLQVGYNYRPPNGWDPFEFHPNPTRHFVLADSDYAVCRVSAAALGFPQGHVLSRVDIWAQWPDGVWRDLSLGAYALDAVRFLDHVGDYSTPPGHYVLRAEIHLPDGLITVWTDLWLGGAPPDCSHAAADPAVLWPPKHDLRAVSIMGVTDPDGDPVTITATGITQDEPLDTTGDGKSCPDGAIVNGQAFVRAERSGGSPGLPGNGRVYVIAFTADDGHGGSCQGTVSVCVPLDRRPGLTCLDDGQTFDSLGPCNGFGPTPHGRPGHTADGAVAAGIGTDVTAVELGAPRMLDGAVVIPYALPGDGDVHLAVFDIAGRHVATLVNTRQLKGAHSVTFATSSLARGVYFCRIQAAGVSQSRALVLTR